MRLRLQIFRNGLPVVKLIWETTARLQPGTDEIVSNLLASVNEIFPLEGSTIGLEEYVVELDGFEVLHFQELSTVFKNDDTVTIRPLSTTEIKQRRLSGRRQISLGGRKLLDGTPFGRPFIRRAPDRPQLLIPSAKRSKRDRGAETSTLQLQDGLEDEDDDEDEDDEDYQEEGEEEGDDVNMEDEEEVTFDPKLHKKAIVRFVPREDGTNDYEVDFDSDNKDMEYNESDDEDFQPETEAESDAEPEVASKEVEDLLRQEMAKLSSKDLARLVVPKTRTVPEPESDSSSDSSDSSFDSESEAEVVHKKVAQAKKSKSRKEPEPASDSSSSSSSDSSDSSSSDSSSSDSEPEVQSSKNQKPAPKSAQPKSAQPKSAQPKSSQSKSAQPKSPVKPKPGPPVAPGTLPYEGNASTKARNARKKAMKILGQLQARGVVRKDISLTHVKSILGEQGLSFQSPREIIEQALSMHESANPKAAAVPQVRAVSTPEVPEVVMKDIPTPAPAPAPATAKPKNISKREKKEYKAALDAGLVEPGDRDGWLAQKRALESDQPLPPPQPKQPAPLEREILPSVSATQQASANKKWKKNRTRNAPATKTVFDEWGNEVTTANEEAMGEYTYLDSQEQQPALAWQDRVILSAVECELPNTTLPTPDFPFDQRQLQDKNIAFNQSKKRKRGKNGKQAQQQHHQHQEQYYEEEQQEYYPETYYDEAVQPSQPTQDTGDLPALPADMTHLPALHLPVLKGMVIAFKHLSMINFQPIITEYRTAKVDAVNADDEKNPMLELTLALRDRPNAEYDEETGERILGRFDMPGVETEADGYLELMFSEMLEPKVVALPEERESQVAVQQEKDNGKGDKGDKGAKGAKDWDQPEGGYGNGGLDYGDDVYEDRQSAPKAKGSESKDSVKKGAQEKEQEDAAMVSAVRMNEDEMRRWEEETFGGVQEKEDELEAEGEFIDGKAYGEDEFHLKYQDQGLDDSEDEVENAIQGEAQAASQAEILPEVQPEAQAAADEDDEDSENDDDYDPELTDDEEDILEYSSEANADLEMSDVGQNLGDDDEEMISDMGETQNPDSQAWPETQSYPDTQAPPMSQLPEETQATPPYIAFLRAKGQEDEEDEDADNESSSLAPVAQQIPVVFPSRRVPSPPPSPFPAPSPTLAGREALEALDTQPSAAAAKSRTPLPAPSPTPAQSSAQPPAHEVKAPAHEAADASKAPAPVAAAAVTESTPAEAALTKPTRAVSRFDIDTDSDSELPSFETILSQRPSVKSEPKEEGSSGFAASNTSRLPPLPMFSPINIRPSKSTPAKKGADKGVEEEESQGDVGRQILRESLGNNGEGIGKGLQRKKKKVQVIDLVSSSPEPEPIEWRRA
ncbi:Similar to hypothetical protein [Tuber melanosporum Mel28]; acc. no. XP_002840981 [Pyronema omphalodes CBS 100304]|uniref:DUF7357 domain-containing protein n=1 Tax=Pyronema omphalodes (strain CBS 100304) TaxID=1076935 RepID=U4L4U3_PYROM|nr:Similar to hypothetical protein [Tuber melanosporum Mel28]; acc. no. XP_002840981 [Pyronema omphalodes CBS 100304]